MSAAGQAAPDPHPSHHGGGQPSRPSFEGRAAHGGAPPTPAVGPAGAAPGAPSPGGFPDPVPDGGEITPELAAALIQRIFGAGLLLAGVSSMVSPGTASERLDSAVAELDLLVRDIRQAVFTRQEHLGYTPAPW